MKEGTIIVVVHEMELTEMFTDKLHDETLSSIPSEEPIKVDFLIVYCFNVLLLELNGLVTYYPDYRLV